MKKKIVYVDMDGVLCDFYGAAKHALEMNPEQKYPQAQWGFFLKLTPIANAITGYNKLAEHLDVRILSRPSFRNVNCYTEKAQWVLDHLGYDALEKMILCGDKSLLKGHYLIDDQDNANQAKFDGEWIKFGSYVNIPGLAGERWAWKRVVNHILSKEGVEDTFIETL